jgi:hypothetical protein
MSAFLFKKRIAFCIVITALALVGCMPGNECMPGAAKCDGNVAYNCKRGLSDTDQPDYWVPNTCGTTSCQVDSQGAFCAPASTQDPFCTPVQAGSLNLCSSNKLVTCRNGFRMAETDCGTKFCIPSLPVASGSYPGLCALAADVDSNCVSRCPFTPGSQYACQICVTNAVVNCLQDFRTAQQDCGTATCIETDPGFFAGCR